MIEWKIETSGFYETIRDLEGLDDALKNKVFSTVLWKKVFEQISVFINKRFEEGKSSWKPLTPKYLKWKMSAVRRGASVNVGSFGRRVCKLTEMGRLTDTMFVSATQQNQDANIFEVKPITDGWQFRYAISGSKLPYSVYFDNKRPFFFITDEEADEVFDVMEKAVEDYIE